MPIMPLVIDKLKSYAAAKKQVLKGVEYRYSQGIEQLSGKLSSVHTSARATNAKIQIPKANATIFVCIWFDSRPLLPQTTSTYRDSAITNNSVNDFKIGEKSLLLISDA
ncbi:MAG: hypothetical protein CLLPBCKN_007017 [Chroococcidiopsis cubana SAG 39.79]|nr:hypothetical protein [Chroococcidiopsis cubana SAG 39.79]